MTIKSKTVLLVMICSMVPLMIISVDFFLSTRAAMEAQVARVLQADAEASLNRLEDFFERAAIDFGSWSTAPAMQDVLIDDDEGLIAGMLKLLREQYPHFGTITVVNDVGTVVATSDDSMKGRDLSGFEAVKTALGGNQINGGRGSSDIVEFRNVVFAAPIRANYDRSSIIGAVVGFVDWRWMRGMLEEVTVVGAPQGGDHYLVLMDNEHRRLLYRSDHVAKDAHNDDNADSMHAQEGVRLGMFAGTESLISTAKSDDRPHFANPDWNIHTVVTTDVAFADIYALRDRLMWIAVAVALLTATVGYLGSITMSRPIIRLTRIMRELAQGRLDVEVGSSRGAVEIGEMAAAVQIFKDNAIEKVRLQQEQAESRQRAEQEKRRGMLELADRFEGQVKEVVDGVSAAATEMQATARQMSANAEETSRQSGTVASASEEAAANVQTVAATTEQLSASISEIGRQVMQSAKIAQNAVAEAETTNATVQGLAEAAGRIGEVVTLINDIAGQTNLLALNATIEAARAGEAGKGFAVVAQEVKNLANQTARATEDISQQISSIQEETTGAVGAIEKIRAIIGEVNDIATTISAAVEEQGVSTQEIARNVQQAARGTQDVNESIESVSRAAGETGTAAGQVLGASEEMSRQAEGLRGEVERFLSDVRAG